MEELVEIFINALKTNNNVISGIVCEYSQTLLEEIVAKNQETKDHISKIYETKFTKNYKSFIEHLDEETRAKILIDGSLEKLITLILVIKII
jgi:hypothetical protein